jgi:hypothetical protein
MPHEPRPPRPRELREPGYHYQQADKLLAEIDDLPGPFEILKPLPQAKLAKAAVHALLAQCAGLIPMPIPRPVNNHTPY